MANYHSDKVADQLEFVGLSTNSARLPARPCRRRRRRPLRIRDRRLILLGGVLAVLLWVRVKGIRRGRMDHELSSAEPGLSWKILQDLLHLSIAGSVTLMAGGALLLLALTALDAMLYTEPPKPLEAAVQPPALPGTCGALLLLP